MGTSASVFEVEAISKAAQDLNQIKSASVEACHDGLNQAMQLLEETQAEEHTSKTMLVIAKKFEMAKHTVVIELEMRLAAAVAEFASTKNPMIMIRIAELESELLKAKQEYEEAVKHREALELRYDMAVKCMNLAKERYDTLQMNFELGKKYIEEIVDKGYARLHLAYQELQKYISRIAPDVRNSIDKWFNDKPERNEPVRPNEIRDKLDVDKNIIDAILEYLYATEVGFRANVDSYCNEIKIGNEMSAELKIKKQMVGRLCEEIVIRAFKPISTHVSTQTREFLPDGRYTKVDLIIYGLTNPIILGRGERMGSREGGSLAVEIKSGHSSYLYQQLSHLQKQALGHQKCDASCIICTRDIHDLSSEKEFELREKLKEAGSPIIGMLPKKGELDSICISFVKGKLQDV